MSIFDESVALLETPWSAPVEDLYQAFKARLVREIVVGHLDLTSHGWLADAEKIISCQASSSQQTGES